MRETRIAGTHAAASVDDRTIVDFVNQQCMVVVSTSHMLSIMPTHDYPTEMHVYANSSSWARSKAIVQHMNTGLECRNNRYCRSLGNYAQSPQQSRTAQQFPNGCHPKLPSETPTPTFETRTPQRGLPTRPDTHT